MCNKNTGNIDENHVYHISEHLGIKKISVQELRKCKGFESVSEEEAMEIIDSIYQLSLVTYQILIENECREI